jgi:hypothetical protein
MRYWIEQISEGELHQEARIDFNYLKGKENALALSLCHCRTEIGRADTI